MNNFSLLAANRVTHLRVVMLALFCVTLVVGFGLVHSALSQEPSSISTIVGTGNWYDHTRLLNRTIQRVEAALNNPDPLPDSGPTSGKICSP